MTLPALPAATPDLTLSFKRDDYFQPAPWFYAAFGVLPRCEIYQLAEAEARQQVLATLAETHDLEAATVAHAMFLEKADKPPEISSYALNLAPHLLLWFYDRDTYGSRGASAAGGRITPAERGSKMHDRRKRRQEPGLKDVFA